MTPQPTRSPTAATDTAVTPYLSMCTSADACIVSGNSQYGGLTCVIVINMTDALYDGKTAAEACCQCDSMILLPRLKTTMMEMAQNSLNDTRDQSG